MLNGVKQMRVISLRAFTIKLCKIKYSFRYFHHRFLLGKKFYLFILALYREAFHFFGSSSSYLISLVTT